jgi:plastocyanin
MTRRLLAVLFLLGAALVLPVVPAYAATATVTIDSTLHPRSLTVTPGTTVTWRNADADRHRIRTTSAPVELDSNDLDSGQSWSFTFRTAGTYRYVDHRNEDDSAYWGTVTVSSSSSPAPAPGLGSPQAPASGTVRIANRAFGPGSLSVRVGGTVTFANADDRAHTVTADDGSFDSGLLNAGASWARRFGTAGTYRYHCAIHPDMRGTVTVPTSTGSVPATKPAAAPAPAAPAAPGGSRPGSARVTVVDFAFTPALLSVHAGDTVSWVNAGQSPHTVTAAGGVFGTSLLAPGATYRTVARRAGTVTYVCSFHSQMRGTLVVLPTGAALPAPVAAPHAAVAATATTPGASLPGAAAAPADRHDDRTAVRRLAATGLWESPLALWSLGSGWGLLAFLGLAWWRAREPAGAPDAR